MMRKMSIQLKEGCNTNKLQKELAEFGRLEKDPEHPGKLTLVFHNQSESGIRMACYRLSEEFIQYFEDFDMKQS